MNEDKASRYHRLKRRATLVWTVTGAAMFAGLLWGGGSRVMRDVAVALTSAAPSAASTVAVYAVALACGYVLLRLPLALYQGLILDRRYGLSSESFGNWARDYLKGAVLVVTLGVCAAEVIYLSLRWSPEWWWMAASAAFVVALVVLARVAPLVLLPLFYRCEPLDRESLRARLAALSARARVPVLGVYVWGLGPKTRRANAALVGTGSTRRILLSDTLLSDYSDDEIEVIIAHEIAHHVHGDIRRGLAIEAGLIVLGFAAAAIVLESLWGALGLLDPADVAGLPLLILALLAVSLGAAPMLNALSRRNEHRADRFALGLTKQPEAFVSAMRRLAAQNLAEERPSRAAVWLFHSHPPIEDRIHRARDYARRARGTEAGETESPIGP